MRTTLTALFVTLATQTHASALNLMCSTLEEQAIKFDGNGKIISVENLNMTEATRFQISSDRIVADIIYFNLYTCTDIILTTSENEIYARCEGTRDSTKSYPRMTQSVTISRYTGQLTALVSFPIENGQFKYFYHASCKKAEKLF